MANINKLSWSFVDNLTTIYAEHMNGIVGAINSIIDALDENSGSSSTPETVATPAISIVGTTATISCSTSDATIYYTINGDTPTTSSTQYSSPITLSGACTIKAIAAKNGVSSSISSQNYTPSTVATPVISINGTSATITCATTGATIYYTTNGNTPTTGSTLYSDAIALTEACTIKAIAVKSGMTNSEVASQSYSPASPVVYKNYATTTVDDQVVFIADSTLSILSGVEALYVDDYKVEISAYLTSTDYNSPTLWGTSVMKAGTLGVNTDVVRAGINTTDNPTDIASEAEAVKAYQLGVNTKTGDAYVNEQTHTCTLYTGHYAMAKAVLFGRITSAGAVSSGTSRTGVWKIASAKIYNATSNTLVADIVPATYNGTPCLYDKVTDTPLYPNTGTLAVE